MRVVTFYSYKGGVGRTLACANFGLYLAKTGQKVVLADMDFEAPGLDSKFSGDGTIDISSGLLDQMLAFQDRAPLPGLHPVDIPLPEEVTRSGGRLQLIPAGNYRAPDEYHKTLSHLNWDCFLQDEQGISFWLDLISRIETELHADVLVIDSRTGITEIGGLCTQVLPDTVLLLTSTSPESMAGTKRIYERIQNSPIIKSRRADRATVDLRVILTRIPRPKDFDEFDKQARQRLGLEVPRLYYLFADSDLAVTEYLAMNRFADEHPPILDDYVELFASLNPEATLPYIESRLTTFREALTRRTPLENRRVIQELLTLFPRPEVYLEAARYYRLVKEGETDSLLNYIRYLDSNPSHEEIIWELANVCLSSPRAQMPKLRQGLVRHLATLSPNRMDAPLLSLYSTLVRSPQELESIVAAIEADPSKHSNARYRTIYFRALSELQQWDKVVASLLESDLKDNSIQKIAAKAYANLHTPDKALQLIGRMQLEELSDAVPIAEILFDMRNEIDLREIRSVARENPRLLEYLRHAPAFFGRPGHRDREDWQFHSWLRDLARNLEK